MANHGDQATSSTKRMVGLCTYFILIIFSLAAVVCGLICTGWCSFVKREIDFQDNSTIVSFCTSLNQTAQCLDLVNNHGVGFFGWQGTVPVDQQVCFSYTQWINDYGYVTPDVGTMFNAAMGFTFVADFFGLMAVFTLAFAACCPMITGHMKLLSVCFFMATLFQGLTLLIFKSNVCQKGLFEPYFRGYPQLNESVYNVTCKLDQGSKLSVVATILYFCSMLLCPVAVPPSPFGMAAEESESRAVGSGDEAKEAPVAPTTGGEDQPKAEATEGEEP